MKKYLVFVGIGFELLGITFVSLWIGLWLEGVVPMRNIWPVLFVFLGLSAWFYRVIRLLKKMNSENEK
jgi:hypothetical protein